MASKKGIIAIARLKNKANNSWKKQNIKYIKNKKLGL